MVKRGTVGAMKGAVRGRCPICRQMINANQTFCVKEDLYDTSNVTEYHTHCWDKYLVFGIKVLKVKPEVKNG